MHIYGVQLQTAVIYYILKRVYKVFIHRFVSYHFKGEMHL